jgi:branched-chain amino acid transport system ATP-binding protein
MSERTNGDVTLRLENVHTFYGSIQALKGISIEVREGEIVTLIGANGAGKSTTLRSINGLNTPREGSIVFQGKNITRTAPHRIVGMGISQSPEGRRLFPHMTVLENLEMGAFQRRDRSQIKDDLDRVYSLFPRLSERKSQRAGTLSGGEQQMLAVGRSLMSRPKLLLLDEPSMGLAPLMVEKIFEVIRQIAAEGVALLLVEQNARLALEASHRAYVLEGGLVTLSGPARDLLGDARIREAYLGGEG